MADKRVIEQTASSELYNDDWFLKDSVLNGTTKISATNLKAILGADGTLALEEIVNAIAEEYDSTHTYTYDDWVFYEGILYRCIRQSVTGTWDATQWQAKTIKDFINTAKNSVLSTIEQMLSEYMQFSTDDPPYIAPISKGDIYRYTRTNREKFYRAKADHPQGVTAFDIDDWDEFDTVADLIEDVTENAGKVADVQVKTTGDYETVVENKIAKIDLSSVTAYGEVPNLPQAIATFKDGADAPMKSLKVAIEPQQDLHGYDSPWVGGAGKNKFDQTTWQYYNVSRKTNATNIPSMVTLLNNLPVGYYTISAKFKVDTVEATQITRNYGFFITTTGSYSPESYTRVDNPTVGSVYSASITVNKSSADMEFSAVYIYAGRSTVSDTATIYDMQLEEGSTATAYAPYSNECPISGWSEVNVGVSGFNVWDEEWEEGNYDNSTGEKVQSNQNIRCKNAIPCKPSTQYYLKSPSAPIVLYYDINGDFITYATPASNTVFTTNPNAYYMRFRMGVGYGTTYNNDISINYPSTDTSYHAYNGHTYTIDLDGTRYGGVLDVVNGSGTNDRGYIVFDGSSDENWVVQGTAGFFIDVSDKKVGMGNYIANNYKATNSSGWDSSTPVDNFSGHPTLSRLYFRYPYEGFSADLTAWRAWLASNNVQVVYELATPTTYDTQPTAIKSLLGQNNIWADTGDIDKAEYQRDATTIINELIARIEALEG